MDKAVIEALGLKMVEAVREAVKRATDPLEAKIKELEARKPDPGPPGKDFDPSLLLPHLEGLTKSAKEVEEALLKRVEEWILAIPVPQNGKDADIAPVTAKLEADLAANVAKMHAEIAEAIAAIPLPKNGEDAKPVDYQKVFERVAEEAEKYASLAVAALPKPEAIHPDTVERMVSEAVEKAVAKIRVPEDGQPGKDALQIEPLPSIDESKSYPRGTYATHLGGTIKAVRNTDPIGPQGLEAAGWQVMADGVSGIVVTQGEDPREITVTAALTSGIKAASIFRIPMVIERGVWKPGTFAKGDGVTLDGSYWISQKDDNTDRPGTSDAWRLAVKKGRDARPQDDAAPKSSGPVRLK